MSIWQIFNRSMSSNEKENWKELKDNLLALMRNNTGLLKNSNDKTNFKNIKKVIHSALYLCKNTVSIVMNNRKKSNKEISKNSLVFQVNENMSSVCLPEKFDSNTYVEIASSIPEIEIDLEKDKKILAKLKELKSNKSSGWSAGIKKLMDYFYEISHELSEKEVKWAKEQQETLNKNYKDELEKFIENNFSGLDDKEINKDRKELISKFAKWFVGIYKKSLTYSKYSNLKFSELSRKGGRESYVKALYTGVKVSALVELSNLTVGVQKEIDLITLFDKIKNKTPQNQVTPHLDLVIQNINKDNLLKRFMDEESYLKKRFVKKNYDKDNIKMVTHPSYLDILNHVEKDVEKEILYSIESHLENSPRDENGEKIKEQNNEEEEKKQKIEEREKIKNMIGDDYSNLLKAYNLFLKSKDFNTRLTKRESGKEEGKYTWPDKLPDTAKLIFDNIKSETREKLGDVSENILRKILKEIDENEYKKNGIEKLLESIKGEDKKTAAKIKENNNKDKKQTSSQETSTTGY